MNSFRRSVHVLVTLRLSSYGAQLALNDHLFSTNLQGFLLDGLPVFFLANIG